MEQKAVFDRQPVFGVLFGLSERLDNPLLELCLDRLHPGDIVEVDLGWLGDVLGANASRLSVARRGIVLAGLWLLVAGGWLVGRVGCGIVGLGCRVVG
jgi:hypothetical protein